MRALLFRTLILLAVIGLVFAPPVVTGFIELKTAESAWTNGDFASSLASYQRATRFLPWRLDLHERTAVSSFFIGDFEASIYLFEKTIQHNRLSANGWDLYGQAYWWSNDHQSAQEIWLAGLGIYPSYSKFYDNLRNAYFEQGNLPAEQDALEHWVTSDGETDAAAHYRLGQLLATSEPERALEEFLFASSLDPEYDSVAETMHTALSMASGETDESQRLVLIGRGLGLLSEWELAKQAFQQAVDANGENAEAWAWLGEAEQQLGQDGRAELDIALKFGYFNSIVRSLRGLYWTRQDDGERALTEYQAAARYDPENPAWQISIGDAYVENGDLLAALDSYTRATEIAPTDATTWRLLAVFSTQYRIKINEVGLPAARMAVELSGEDPLALDTLGWALAILERYDDAQDTLEHALSLDPNLAQAHLHLGVVAIQLEDWEMALEHLQQARDLDAGGLMGERAQVLLNQYFP